MSRSPSRPPQGSARSELAVALASCRGAFIGIGLISAMSNVLMLTGAMFMLEIYDRVLQRNYLGSSALPFYNEMFPCL